jgi:hypothetical protein
MTKLAELLVRKAGIEGLHQCPFCDYMAERENQEDKVFKCQVRLLLEYFWLDNASPVSI